MKKTNGKTPRRKLEYTGVLIGKEMQDHRKKSGISRAGLSEQSGISVSQISKIENGMGYPPILVYLKLAKVLKVRLSEIIHGIERELPD